MICLREKYYRRLVLSPVEGGGASVGGGGRAALAHWMEHLAPAASLFLLEVNFTHIMPSLCCGLNFFVFENLA